MKNLYILLLILFSGVTNADDWSTSDTNREITYHVFHALDWAQTRYIGENCNKHRESNPLLSSCPSNKEVDTFFIATSFFHYAVSRLLPSDYRKGWQYVTIGSSANAVYTNYNIGVKMSW